MTKSRLSSPVRKEIDLRQEMENLLSGSSQEIAKAYQVLVRRMRVDSQGRKLPCTCNSHGEGSTDPSCSLCLGEGYYWDESFKDSFKVEVGSESAKARRILFEAGGSAKGNLTRFFFRYNTSLITSDRIIELKMDEDGNPVNPGTRGTHWQIQEIEYRRSDQGRVEFAVAYCSKIDHIFDSRSRR